MTNTPLWMKKARPFYEIFSNINDMKTKKERVEALRNLASYRPAFLNILKLYEAEWALPEGAPPFEPNEFELPNGLWMEAKRLYLYIKGQTPESYKQTKREMAFKELLETLEEPEAKFLVQFKDHKLPYKNMTHSLFKEAFPDEFEGPKRKSSKKKANSTEQPQA